MITKKQLKNNIGKYIVIYEIEDIDNIHNFFVRIDETLIKIFDLLVSLQEEDWDIEYIIFNELFTEEEANKVLRLKNYPHEKGRYTKYKLKEELFTDESIKNFWSKNKNGNTIFYEELSSHILEVFFNYDN